MIPGLEETIANARQNLLKQRNSEGYWPGKLSTSPLSTATAIVALHGVDAHQHATTIQRGANWLMAHQNDDGGWGDTTRSFSNISTTLLCWSAVSLTNPEATDALKRAEDWLVQEIGSLEPTAIARKVSARYGRDRTFAVPILMLCAICGRLGDPTSGWRRVLPLPFELAAFPREWFAALRFPVVSYALPALIAIGYARFHHAPPPWPFRIFRQAIWPKVSRLLEQIQPSSGGFLEAAPLTSFVTMALASAEQKDHPVVENGVRFLLETVRDDGSWPIDTNLATWNTTLATKALLTNPTNLDFPIQDRAIIKNWLMDQQYREVHPFTNAAPGGWAWTDLPGGVPDADDTPGTLLALRQLTESPDDETMARVETALIWLLDLQNSDGGIPTFCRGWGTLPFDRSSPDLTAHTLRAWHAWKDFASPQTQARIDRHAESALRFLKRHQAADRSWTPLWFGNQHVADESNKTYGTALVSLALAEVANWLPGSQPLTESGLRWLTENQNEDGGWGGERGSPSSVEETALATATLGSGPAAERGIRFLIEATDRGHEFPATPIGFYFAKLWYFEELYPVIWTISALERFAQKS